MAKINLKRGLTDIVLYMIIFIVVQIIVMYAGAGIWAGIKGEGYQATLLAISSGSNPILMALTSAFSNVITLVIFLKTTEAELKGDAPATSAIKSNKMMQQRVIFQGVTILIVCLALLVLGNGR